MEGRPSIRVKLIFHDNPHGADPATTVEGVLTFPGRGYKGVVKPGQLWDCDVVFASHNYVMVAPRVELEDALDSELGVLRLHQGAREVAHVELNDAMDLLRSGEIPPPVLTPRPLPPKKPPAAPSKTIPPSTKAARAMDPPALPPPAAPAAPPTAPPVALGAPPRPSPATSAAAAAPAAPTTFTPTHKAPASPLPESAAAAPVAGPEAIHLDTAPPPATSPSGQWQPQRQVPAPNTSAPTPAPRSLDDWRRAIDGPDGRAFLELLAERLGVSSALPRIEDTIDGQEEILSVLRGEAGDIRKTVKDLGAQIEDVRRQTLAWRRKENQDLRGVPKPVPIDADHPTDQEVEREIIHQLYQKDCWGNKYGQYEKLKRGYNSKASDRQVRAAVQRLQEKRWILIYAKDTDQFRLNPARAEDIYRFLGVPDREADQLAEGTRDELERPDVLTKRELDAALEGVATRVDIERALAPIRQKLSALEERRTPALPSVEQPSARSGDLAEIKGMLKGLQGELNRLKKLAEDTANAQRRLEAKVALREAGHAPRGPGP